MTDEPGSGVRQGGRRLTATSQVTNHRFCQEEAVELGGGGGGGHTMHVLMAHYFLCQSLHRDKTLGSSL